MYTDPWSLQKRMYHIISTRVKKCLKYLYMYTILENHGSQNIKMINCNREKPKVGFSLKLMP